MVSYLSSPEEAHSKHRHPTKHPRPYPYSNDTTMPVTSPARYLDPNANLSSITVAGSPSFQYLSDPRLDPQYAKSPPTAAPFLFSTEANASGKALEAIPHDVDAEKRKLMLVFLEDALKKKKEGNPTLSNSLIAKLTAPPDSPEAPTPQTLEIWIALLSQFVSQLNRSCSDLVEAVLSVDWTVREDSFVRTYISFLGNLVSAHAFYVVPVMKILANGLIYRSHPPSTVRRSRIYQRVHHALRYILSLIPTGPTALSPLLVAEFPHKREALPAQITFLRNLLKVIEYAPILRNQLLSVVVERIIQIDVEIQVEFEELEEEESDMGVFEFDLGNGPTQNTDSADLFDTIAETDIHTDDSSDSDISDVDSGSESESDGEAHVTTLNIKDLITKLDPMLRLVFDHIERTTSTATGTPESRNDMFFALLDIFDRTILQTFKSRYTQFLLFYYCSVETPTFPDAFLGHLMSKLLDVSQPTVTRIAAAAYISSFVSRARYLDVNCVRTVVQMLGGWCQQYMDQYESEVTQPDQVKYGVFYAVVQALLYVFCFRWRVLVEEGDASAEGQADWKRLNVGGTPSGMLRKWCVGLNGLQRTINSKFNPLKMCSPNVVKQFARLSHSVGFLYVYPILEKNKRLFYLTSSPLSRSVSTPNSTKSDPAVAGVPTQQDLESFFPFDPYRLKMSMRYIKNLYLEWQGDDEEEESDDEDDGEEDDDDEMNTGLMAMSVSPSPTVNRLGSELLMKAV